MSSNAAQVADVRSIDSVIHAMYEVISGPAGQPRDWERLKYLYAPGARLMPIISNSAGPARIRILSPDEYIRRVEPIFANEDFWERETSRKEETFGHVAHVLSAYESLHNPTGPAFEHGTNSVQLFYDSVRWWIVSVMWNTPRSE